MDQIFATIRLENALNGPVRVVETFARVDTDMPYLCLPATVVAKLELASNDARLVELTDGSRVWCRYVGPIRLQLGQSQAFTGAVELGDEVVLGSIPLSALVLKIDHATGKLTEDRPPRVGLLSIDEL